MRCQLIILANSQLQVESGQTGEKHEDEVGDQEGRWKNP